MQGVNKSTMLGLAPSTSQNVTFFRKRCPATTSCASFHRQYSTKQCNWISCRCCTTCTHRCCLACAATHAVPCGHHAPSPQRARVPLHHHQARGTTLIVHGDDIRGAHMEKALFGENFGARDAFAGEIETGFGEKALGFASTEHIVKPPDKIKEIVGLSSKRCIPCEGGDEPKLSEHDIERLKKQVPGWKLAVDRTGVQCIRCQWTVRNFAAGLELFGRIGEVAEQQGHHPDLHLEGYNTVYADLSTHALGGLTENDFIMAAKINELDVSDLMPKKKPRFWA